jgi:hypothetical protein
MSLIVKFFLMPSIPLVYPKNATIMHVTKMTLSTIVILCVLSPFIYGTIQKLKKHIVYVVYDEFTPCYEDWCMNGGIQLSTWGFEIGDGSQYINTRYASS